MELLFQIKESGQIANRKKMAEFFAQHRPGTYLLVSKPRKQRSNLQNAYFHGPMMDLVREGLVNMGWDWVKTNEDAKEVVKGLFLKVKRTNEKTGEEMEMVRHTSDLSTVEFGEFVAEIQRWAASYLSVVIPDPGGHLEIDFTP